MFDFGHLRLEDKPDLSAKMLKKQIFLSGYAY